MSAMASQITSLTSAYSTVYSDLLPPSGFRLWKDCCYGWVWVAFRRLIWEVELIIIPLWFGATNGCQAFVPINGAWRLHRSLIRSSPIHDDAMTGTHFPHYWSFVRGNHRSPVDFFTKGKWCDSFIFIPFAVCLNKLSNKQSNCRWFGMSWCSCELTNKSMA